MSFQLPLHLSPLRPDRRKILASLLAAAVWGFHPAPATSCGPFFPNQVLTNGDAGVLSMPIGSFQAEMDLLCPTGAPPFAAAPPPLQKYSTYDHMSPAEQSANTDIDELKSALSKTNAPPAAQSKILDDYSTARYSLTAMQNALTDWRAKNDPNVPRPAIGDIKIPAGIPQEFSDYLRGVAAFYAGDAQTAQTFWLHLLSLPPEQRHLRSTWAAYMMGKSSIDTDPAKAGKYFALCRRLAQSGYADSIGLASSSLGWEAKAYLHSHKYSAAIDLYMRQKWTGDPTAEMSLRDTAGLVLNGTPQDLSAAATDDLSRRVVAAFILSAGGPYRNLSDAEKRHASNWLTTVENTATTDIPGADKLAWAAYLSGNFDSAARWVAHASAGAPVAQWVRTKLLLRDGNVPAAAAVLAKVVKSFPPDTQWLTDDGNRASDADFDENLVGVRNIVPPIVGDLAVLQLARGQYVDSMDLLLRADFWMDAAYIAERVLTVGELKTYVDHHFPDISQPANQDRHEAMTINSKRNQSENGKRIRYLLARRLTRQGQWKTARPYYPPELLETLTNYISGIRTGHDASQPDSVRAAGFLDAARIARHQGMELLGTELEPDFFCYDGSFNYSEQPEIRGANTNPHLTAPTSDERARYQASALSDTRRFHYRYIAADHAWAAAQLMPDDDEQTASVLYEAGCWIKDTDPQTANRFYKALISRCADTKMGKSAAAHHWFPDPSKEPQ